MNKLAECKDQTKEKPLLPLEFDLRKVTMAAIKDPKRSLRIRTGFVVLERGENRQERPSLGNQKEARGNALNEVVMRFIGIDESP